MTENIVRIELEGETWKSFLNKKTFSTGSRGYHAQGQMQVGDKRYTMNILLYEVGSKPTKKKEKMEV